jgi:hypothetical protein
MEGGCSLTTAVLYRASEILTLGDLGSIPSLRPVHLNAGVLGDFPDRHNSNLNRPMDSFSRM